jgi:hypothetical protein
MIAVRPFSFMLAAKASVGAFALDGLSGELRDLDDLMRCNLAAPSDKASLINPCLMSTHEIL